MGPPPGAPPDFAAPVLLGTIPESLAVLPGYDTWVEFRFDEVIDEGGQPNFGFGTGALEQLVTVSPDSGVPRVRWRRNRILVQPNQGWRPDVVYRVELGAGVRDIAIRPNARDSAAVVTFTTGAPLPTHWLEGRTVDWMQHRFAPRTLIQALLLPDSLVYRTTTDSSGSFRFGPLPEGEYLVTALMDANSNRRQDGREAWDSVRTAPESGNVGEIWMFPRDTMPPRIDQNGVTRADSFGVSITLNQPVDPDLRLGPDAITVIALPDSVPVPATSAMPAVSHDSIYAPIDSARRAIAAQIRAAEERDSIAAVRADSLGVSVDSLAVLDSLEAAAADTVPETPERPIQPQVEPAEPDTADRPLQDRPTIGTRLMIRLSAPLLAGTRYNIEVRGVRALSGTVADTLRGVLVMPDPPKTAADSTEAATDSAAASSTSADSVSNDNDLDGDAGDGIDPPSDSGQSPAGSATGALRPRVAPEVRQR